MNKEEEESKLIEHLKEVLQVDSLSIKYTQPNVIEITSMKNNINGTLTLDKRRRKATLTINNEEIATYKYDRNNGDIVHDNSPKEGDILYITEKSKKDPTVILERSKKDNICNISIPSMNIASSEVGVVSDDNIIGIPDGTITKEGDEYELTTKDNDKYSIINDGGTFKVYSKTTESVRLTKEDVIEQVSQLQEDSHTLPIKDGFFSYTWAFVNSPMGMLAQDVGQMKLLLQRMLREEMKGEWEKYVPLAFAVLIIVVAIIAIVMTLGGK